MNSGKSLTLTELYQVHRMKDHSKKISYQHVLELVHRRIRNVNSYGGMNTFYEIPGMLVGYPLYNLPDCQAFLVEQLRSSGFLVQILPPPHVCVLYISWDPKELRPMPKALTHDSPSGPEAPMKPKKGPSLTHKGKYF